MSLSDEDLQRLWAAYVATRAPEALELLMAQYASLAGYLGRKALAKAPAFQDREDILSYAHHGLLDAIQRFDPGQGVKFETYATRRITGSIIDGQRSQDPLARQTRRKVKLVQAAVDQLWEDLDREPSIDEIAARTEMTVDEVRATLLAQQTLNASLDAEETETRGVASEAEVTTMMSELRGRLASRLASLSVRSRIFMLHLYVDDLAMNQVAKVLGISPAWCRQTRSAAMQELRR
jgi:RNA polymerase sigma factor for flagellar operon FliA